jgi:hypothetical protein
VCTQYLGRVEVVATDNFRTWYDELDDAASDDVDVAVEVLSQLGVLLGHPRSSAIKGATFALRELRIQSNGRPLRVFYAFDPARNAVLIIGGDKTGDQRFYDTMIGASEKIWKEYLDETAQMG